jgi:hypothetical protein
MPRLALMMILLAVTPGISRAAETTTVTTALCAKLSEQVSTSAERLPDDVMALWYRCVSKRDYQPNGIAPGVEVYKPESPAERRMREILSPTS